MAAVTGLEPAAFAVTGRRSNQLSYTPAKKCIFSVLHQSPFATSLERSAASTDTQFRKTAPKARAKLVEPKGVEPSTFALRTRRSTN